MILSFTLLPAFLLIPVQAMPKPQASHELLQYLSRRQEPMVNTTAAMSDVTEAQILILAPMSKTCDNAEVFKDECRNVTVAAKELSKGFMKYNVTSPGAKAALASLVAYESGEFRFNINQ
jgi:hypothetical protein